MPKHDASQSFKQNGVPCDQNNVIDLRGASKITETSVNATLEDGTSALSRVASARGGMEAYRSTKRKGQKPAPKIQHTTASQDTQVADARVLRSEASIRKVKFSVLKALHAQSNAGSVNIREVSAALDEILRKP